jgi:hypothetical protein
MQINAFKPRLKPHIYHAYPKTPNKYILLMAKAAVTFSTLPEQTHNNSAERNCRKCNAKQSLYIIINNSKFAEYKMLSTLPIKIIPLPYARVGRRPALRAASRSPRRSRSPTTESSPVPPSQTLGVLCFPLSPPSRKGATQEPEID